MNTFKSKYDPKYTVAIRPDAGVITVRQMRDDMVQAETNLDTSDAPAIALAALEAGGIAPLFYTSVASNKLTAAQLAEQGAYYLQRSARKAAKDAAAAAEEAARDKRRDELALELTDGCEPYRNTSPVLSRAVDMIIDGEMALAKERDGK